MSLSYAEATAAVTAPGEHFETATATARGIEHTVFTNAPPSLREVVASTRLRGDETFLVYEDERWSFTDFADEVDALAAALVDRYGVHKGDRVALALRNYPEWVVAFAAVVSIGATSVSLNAWWTSDEIAYALEDSAPRVLVADVERVERSRSTAGALGLATIGVRLPPSAVHEGVDRWEDVVVRGAPMPDVTVDADDDATILYTSGTTGRPKKVLCRRTGPSCRRCSASVAAVPSIASAAPRRRQSVHRRCSS